MTLMRLVIYGMVFSGAALMVYNIYGFIQFARHVKGQKSWQRSNSVLNVPILLLVSFLLGYLAVGLFGDPDLIMAGILFGGSIFVFVIYKLLDSIIHQLMKSESLEAELLAAEESNRTKISFMSSISHELRTPLNVIVGLDNMALRSPSLPADTRDKLEKIGLSAKHLLMLINNLLDANNLNAGELLVKDEPFSMSLCIAQLNAMIQTMCAEKGLTYTAEADEGAGFTYRGDELHVKQVLLSILENAVKYTDAPGSVSFTLKTLSADAEKRTLQFTVKDTGVGISGEFLPKLFEVFTQEDASSTNRFGGSGLSLYVTKKIITLMGGEIAVESEKNVGTVFTVTIPFPIAGEPAAESAEAADESVSLSGAHILVVDDIEDNAEIVMDLLELEEAECEWAENGQIAVDMMAASPVDFYDAVLMDLRMPVMDGLEAARRIRALPRKDAKAVPIIALTANALETDVKNTMAAGMNAHLAKPADADQLYDTLKAQISLRKTGRSLSQ